MKKIKMFIFTLFITIFALNYINTNASDITNNFTITDLKFCDSIDCTTEFTDTNGVVGNRYFLAKISWKYQSDTPIEAGDTITITFGPEVVSETTTNWGGSVTKVDMQDSNGNVIGQWEMINAYGANHKLKIYFSDYAVGKTSLSGTLITPKNINTQYTYKDIVVPFKYGNKTKNVLILKNTLSENNSGFSYGTSGGDNSNVVFQLYTPNKTLNKLYRYDEYTTLPSSVIYNNIVCVVPVPSNSIRSQIQIRTRFVMPTNLENHYASGNNGSWNDIISRFTNITPNTNESLEDFKNRLTPFQYGIYHDEDRNQAYVVNFGNQPNDTLTYKDVLGKEPGDYANEKIAFTFDSQMKDILNTALGINNIIGGRVAQYVIRPFFYYNPVTIETPVPSTVTCSWQDIDNNNQTVQLTQNHKLSPAVSLTTVKGQIKLVLLDKNNKLALNGVSITIQKKEGGIWKDISTKTTNEDGSIFENDLENGEYRFIQNNYLDHYKNNSFKLYSDSSNNNEISTIELTSDGNISYATNERENYTITYKPGEHGDFTDQTYNVLYGDTTPIFTETKGLNDWKFIKWNPNVDLVATKNATYTAEWEKKVTITKHYYLEGTTTKIKSDEEEVVKVGESYNVTRSTVANKYQYLNTVGTESGIVPDGNIEIKYYYKLKPATLTIKYIEDGTNVELLPTETKNLKYDDLYITESKAEKNYTLIRTQGDLSGKVEQDNILVIYFYKKKDSIINSSITKVGTEEIKSKIDKVNYKITYTVDLEDYIGNGTIEIVDKLPFIIDEEKSDLDGGTYNNNMITWTESWNDIDTYNGTNSKTIIKNIKVYYKNINSKERVMTNRVEGNLTLDNNSNKVINDFYTNIKIKGKVIIKYLDEDNNEIEEAIIREELVGNNVNSDFKDFAGYYIIEKPDTEIHEIEDEVQEIVYKYQRYVYDIETTSTLGGRVRGNESVKYGDDSTPNNIIIEADSGYCIDKIKVNNENIKVTSCKKQVLNNFTNVKENKKINVYFRKESIINPSTYNIAKIVIGIIIIITILLSKSYFNKNKLTS